MTTPRLTGYPVDEAVVLQAQSERRARRDRRKAGRQPRRWFGWLYGSSLRGQYQPWPDLKPQASQAEP